jgi:hypothetical protein
MAAKGNQPGKVKTPGKHVEDRMSPELRRRLHAQAVIEGRLIGDVVSDAVTQYLSKKGK